MKVSIICCTYNRPKELARLKASLDKQTFKDFELILCEEEGNLVELKDKGWRKAQGEIVIWVDDDIECSEKWLETIVTIFDNRIDVVGVTGPTFIPEEYLKNRDVFKGGLFKIFYNWFFLEDKAYYPGQITRCGASTLGANYNTKLANQPQFVMFLEPAHFAIRKWVVDKVGGFDLEYKGVAEWCDVDLSYRIRQYGGLVYHPQIKVWHYPIKDTTTAKRRDTHSRYLNYCKWSKKYITPCLKHKLYKLFLRIYFWSISVKSVD